MLKSFFKELQSILGDEYGLFQEFDTKVAYSGKTKKKYKNVGVFYATGGQFNLLPNGAGLTANFTLELFMRVEETYTDSSPVVKPLELLAAHTNGVIYSETAEGQVAYDYVFNCGVPTSDGNPIEGVNCYWIRYEIPLDAVISNAMQLSDGGEIYITVDGQKLKLNGVVTSTESDNVVLDTNLNLADFANKSLVTARSWGMQVTAMYMPKDALHKYLRQMLIAAPETVLTMEYTAGDETVTKQVVLHDCVFANERGQFVTMVLNMAEALTVEEIN